MSEPLRLVFAGTPEFALPALQACLASGAQVPAVYTQPDRPAGRGRQLLASPIKQAALAAGIPVEQPETLRDPAARARLAAHAPDLLVVVAYGLILPKSVLALPRLGCWNVHASLLPRWRGAAPIQRALLAGDAETGVDLMQMEAGLDTGPVLLEARTPITDADTGGSLHDRLAALGGQLLADALARLQQGETLSARPQRDEGVEYAHKLDKAEAVLDWNDSARALARKVRAFDPWPVAETRIEGERVRVWSALPLDRRSDAAPGTLVAASAEGIDIASGEGVLRILELQRDGGRRISARDWLNARRERERT
ncbi:MAG: methionyl-tRNA formyltransferase [Dokdonella sp.]|uniref:methionyl-tRNA formyltransferase n=1 Tax=Dokdonella sp. TaxID=2291710 RepID=UPI0025BC52CB|nr:methionyl-tRNA formyltransferase [Dokdonella sp.]MBZ0222265.1 methionyl-tRNA formyltransferase [Dokdonella sp.]MCC7256572.1 methionyl-tRNA formyltransferase [Dokdonella sp.]